MKMDGWIKRHAAMEQYDKRKQNQRFNNLVQLKYNFKAKKNKTKKTAFCIDLIHL